MNEKLIDNTYTPKGSTCMRWQGSMSISGWPMTTTGARADQLVWMNKYGRIPLDYTIYHSCDNNDCLNIHHMYVKPEFITGTREEVEVIKVRGGRQTTVRRRKSTKRKPRKYQPRIIEPLSVNIKELFDYDNDQLIWKEARHGTYVGQPVGTLNKLYNIRMASIDGIKYRVEDLVWMYFHGQLLEHERIVPINGNPSDCRIENLHKIEVFPK